MNVCLLNQLIIALLKLPLSNKKENGRYANIQRVDPSMTSGLYYNTLYIDEDECIRCYACVHACPAGAISPQHSLEPSH